MALECSRYTQGPLPAAPSKPRVARSLLHTIAQYHEPTYLHVRQVALYTTALARHIGLHRSLAKTAYMAGLLHDIGKVAIPVEILTKPGRLSAAEKEIMDRHPILGSQIALGSGASWEVRDAIRHHHEWWSGAGYPGKLAGNAIPLLARLIAVSDAFSSMTTPRPYRQVVSVSAAIDELERCSGTQFDPDLVPEFIAMIRKPNLILRNTLPYTPLEP